MNQQINFSVETSEGFIKINVTGDVKELGNAVLIAILRDLIENGKTKKDEAVTILALFGSISESAKDFLRVITILSN